MSEPRDLVLGTAGHIDHGKTSLVLALTGVDTDRLPAEKQRGITIDLGFAQVDLDGIRLAMVDVPGHERFVRNMLAGATGLDLALLVVAADDSVMPQTREHLEILRLLGLSGGVIALTKTDLVEPAWQALVEDEIRSLVAGTFLDGAEIVPTSTATGQGISALKEALKRACIQAQDRPDPGLFRMAIDRAFTIPGHGTVVTGTVASGRVALGDDLIWHPQGRTVRVRGIQRHDRPVEAVARGARAAINLAGVHHAEIQRGQELGSPGYLRASRLFSVELQASPDAVSPIRHRARYRLHVGTADVAATVALLQANELRPGERGLAQVFLAEPLVAVHGEPFVLREESPAITVGGGRILQPCPRRIRRRDAKAIERLGRLRAADVGTRAAAALAFQGLASWTDQDLIRDAGVTAGEVSPLITGLMASGAVVELPLGPRRTVKVLAEVAADLEDRVLRALGRLHAARPRQSTIRRPHVLAELPDLANDALVSGILDRLKGRNAILADDRTVALKSHEPKLSQGERKLKDEIAAAYASGGLSPPDVSEIAAKAGSRAAVVPELLNLLADEGILTLIGPAFYLDARAEADMRRRVFEYLAAGASLTMAELRDLIRTTRKFAVPIGEYLDRVGLTRRDGDVRRLNQPAMAAAEEL